MTQSSVTAFLPATGVAGSLQQLAQSALMKRSMSWAGRGWPSLAQNDWARTQQG
ncbi:hypothetical protein [Polaromonas sp.]|uniref:hypothetical protein n=1 Tax=Polaromonas sp. TaxID=1869339 RepID=UPI001A3187F6|nr:hypothetical protein [Burkholderiales bacterium]